MQHAVFAGNAELTIDAKGRLAIPSKHRGRIKAERDGTGWYCVPWPTGVLRLYPEATFEALALSAESSLTPDEDRAELDADLYGLAELLEPDGSGRITLPRLHLELTELGTEVVVVGAGSKLEVRDRATWKSTMPARFQRLPTLVERTARRSDGGS